MQSNLMEISIILSPYQVDAAYKNGGWGVTEKSDDFEDAYKG